MQAQYDTTDLAMNTAQHAGDEQLLVKFYTKPVLDKVKSKEAGRNIFVPTTYISIMQPGNKATEINDPATQKYRERFPEHYRKFTARESQEDIEGTILEEWAGITRSQCEELKFLNVRTVEQLAGLADSNTQNMMGLSGLKQKAADFLKTSESSATAEKFAALEAKYEALMAKMSEMSAAPVAITEKPKRKRRSKAEMEAAQEAFLQE